jgi:thiol-disulfide isomerase/thioredoxin
MTPRRLGAVIFGLALLAPTCDSRSPDEPSTARVPAQNATEAPLLPVFADELPTMDPPTFVQLLEQLRGTPVLVNIWGSWCPPCLEEMPRLVEAHREFGDRVQFIGIDILDSRNEARDFMEDFEMTFPSVFDAPDEIKGALGQFGQPVTIFYDRDGNFFRSWAGPIPMHTLRRNLEAIAG